MPDDQRNNVLLDYANEYGDLLNNYGVNHDDIDFKRYKYTHKWEFDDIKDGGKWTDFLNRMKLFISDNAIIGAASAAAISALASLLATLVHI